MAAQGVVSSILGLVDNLMVGVLGEVQLSAVGVAMQVFFVHYLLMFGFIGGTATYMAQFYGCGDKENIRKVVGFTIAVCMGIGIVFFIPGFFFADQLMSLYVGPGPVRDLAVKYVIIGSLTFFTLPFAYPLQMAMKATQQTVIPMAISGAVFTLNTILNYLLIFGKFGCPALGVEGAAIATVIARTLEAFIAIWYVLFSDKIYFKGHISEYWKWDRALIKKMVKNATPTTINEFLWSLGQSMYVAAFARIGTSPYAGYQAATTIRSIFAFASFSIGEAALIMIGEALGRKDTKQAYYLGKKLLRIGTIAGVVTGAVMIGLAWPMTLLFNLTDTGMYAARMVLVVYGITLCLAMFTGINIAGILRAGGDTTFAMLTEGSCIWLIGVPLAFITALIFGLPIYWCALIVRLEDLVKAVILYARFKSRKWINTLVH